MILGNAVKGEKEEEDDDDDDGDDDGKQYRI